MTTTTFNFATTTTTTKQKTNKQTKLHFNSVLAKQTNSQTNLFLFTFIFSTRKFATLQEMSILTISRTKQK
jgi:hypothetical protein